MLSHHNPLKIVALTMGVEELVLPDDQGLLEGDVFVLKHITHFHQVGFDSQKLIDLAQASEKNAFLQQQDKTLEPMLQSWQHSEDPAQVTQQQTQGLLCTVGWNCQCKQPQKKPANKAVLWL